MCRRFLKILVFILNKFFLISGCTIIGSANFSDFLLISDDLNSLKLHTFKVDHILLYENLNAIPEITYGKAINSNYQNQKLELSKHFNVIG